MQKEVRFKVRKDLDPQEQQRVIKLKGSLISKGYTEIIHIRDQGEEFHLNTFRPRRVNEMKRSSILRPLSARRTSVRPYQKLN
jgi:hypothetical protein